MRRRGKAGIGALSSRRDQRNRYQKRGEAIQQLDLEKALSGVETFHSKLSAFALKHRASIEEDPLFRQQFNQMCSKIGVDPLTSAKGFWSEVLGVGDFYFALGVQVTETCMKTRPMNGGLIELETLLDLLRKKRGENAPPISRDDILRTLEHLRVLGGGYEWFKVGSKVIVQSLPLQLSPDHNTLMAIGEKNGGYFSRETISRELPSWDSIRTERAITSMVKEGVVWIDTHKGVTRYYFPQSMKMA